MTFKVDEDGFFIQWKGSGKVSIHFSKIILSYLFYFKIGSPYGLEGRRTDPCRSKGKVVKVCAIE